MNNYALIEYFDLVSENTVVNIGDSSDVYMAPYYSIRPWIGALGLLLEPLTKIMQTGEEEFASGINIQYVVNRGIREVYDNYSSCSHRYSGFYISDRHSLEADKLESAIYGFKAALGFNRSLVGNGWEEWRRRIEKNAVEKDLVIYTDSQLSNISLMLPDIKDMVRKFHKREWQYEEYICSNWIEVVDLVCDRINKFVSIASEYTSQILSERLINAFNPLLDEVCPYEGDIDRRKVLDALSTGQFGLIIGEEGIGKTMLSLEIALEVSASKEKSNTLSTILKVENPGAVIGIFQEDDKKDIKRRCTNIGERLGVKEAPYLGAMTHDDFDDALNPYDRKLAILEYIKKAVAFKGAPGWKDLSLIIIDPIGLLIEGDESGAEPMKVLCDFLSKIAREYNCAVLGVHHPTKSAKLKPYGQGGTLDLNAAAGHPILTRCARWVLNISRAKKDEIKLKITKSNNGELTGKIHHLVKVNDKGEPFISGDNFAGFALTKKEVKDKSNTEKVLEALQCIELSKGSKTKVIENLCKITGYSRNKVREALEHLEESGRIESSRTAKGIQLTLVNCE